MQQLSKEMMNQIHGGKTMSWTCGICKETVSVSYSFNLFGLGEAAANYALAAMMKEHNERHLLEAQLRL